MPPGQPACPRLAGRRLGVLLYAISQVVLLALLYVGYGFSRHLAIGREEEALDNAVEIWRLERFLRLPGEAALQSALLAQEWLLRGANWYYIGVHFPAAVLLLVWVFGLHRGHWRRVRNTIVLATGAGLLIQLLFPLAPPRFLSEVSPGVRMVDTGAVLGPSPYGDATDGVANQYAAMPSLHVGWAILEAWAVVTILRHRARWLVLLHPLATVFVVVVTANHYWLDGLVGGLLVVGAVALVGRRGAAPAGATAAAPATEPVGAQARWEAGATAPGLIAPGSAAAPAVSPPGDRSPVPTGQRPGPTDRSSVLAGDGGETLPNRSLCFMYGFHSNPYNVDPSQ
ncbi:PAP2 superfamily protein [Frankia sp. EI5c]|uniref:phosphatase PAP2 family protein n=1 Tax=Frankia sp. EI5c TaxID=683316 RepID=UPI0007C3D7FB|nr:phosphatase PAP2 family protein [Frankia sp. EI5c]OAA25575.1 PAP2 superfamily protein [Frankia sp. EI5c]